jgi:acyl-CoA thioester hydrolase
VRFEHVLTPRFSDLDIYNHVNNAVYLTYFEEARVAFTRHTGMRALYTRTASTILAQASIDYKAPALLGDSLAITLVVGAIRRSAFEFLYEIRRVQDSALIATGKSTQVCFNFELNTPVRIPESWRALLEQYATAAFPQG